MVNEKTEADSEFTISESTNIEYLTIEYGQSKGDYTSLVKFLYALRNRLNFSDSGLFEFDLMAEQFGLKFRFNEEEVKKL